MANQANKADAKLSRAIAAFHKATATRDKAATALREALDACERIDCQKCGGSGKIGRFVCPHCNRTGYCPEGCDWVGFGPIAHKPVPRQR